jgi:hypothetical protein
MRNRENEKGKEGKPVQILYHLATIMNDQCPILKGLLKALSCVTIVAHAKKEKKSIFPSAPIL